MQVTYRLKTYRVDSVAESLPVPDPGPVTTPRTASKVLKSIYATLDAGQEHFSILALNSKGRPVGYKVLSSGTATGCLVTPEMVFRAALLLGGVSVLCCHNHPSGNTTPSGEDTALTRRLRAAGENLGLPLADHIIISGDPDSDEFHSFRADEGWDRA